MRLFCPGLIDTSTTLVGYFVGYFAAYLASKRCTTSTAKAHQRCFAQFDE
jgi:hypothetical protein